MWVGTNYTDFATQGGIVASSLQNRSYKYVQLCLQQVAVTLSFQPEVNDVYNSATTEA